MDEGRVSSVREWGRVRECKGGNSTERVLCLSLGIPPLSVSTVQYSHVHMHTRTPPLYLSVCKLILHSTTSERGIPLGVIAGC
jgi:hypothetical protein